MNISGIPKQRLRCRSDHQNVDNKGYVGYVGFYYVYPICLTYLLKLTPTPIESLHSVHKCSLELH